MPKPITDKYGNLLKPIRIDRNTLLYVAPKDATWPAPRSSARMRSGRSGLQSISREVLRGGTIKACFLRFVDKLYEYARDSISGKGRKE